MIKNKILLLVLLFTFTVSCTSRKSMDKQSKTVEKNSEAKKANSDKVDYRLNDIWSLQTINGKEVNENFKKAYLEFNLTKNKVYGNTGCNSLSGDLKVEGDVLILSKLAVTNMYCEGYSNEQDFLYELNQPMRYKIFELKLTLISDSKTLVFKKGD